jgi:hypothetical protein
LLDPGGFVGSIRRIYRSVRRSVRRVGTREILQFRSRTSICRLDRASTYQNFCSSPSQTGSLFCHVYPLRE